MAATGILGGTFDPVHNAHLTMANAGLEQLRLEKVIFIPTGNTLYRQPAVASGAHRVAMLRLALSGNPKYELDARELAPGASGYTADTLQALHAEGRADLYLLLGADQYAKLESWHRPHDVVRLAKLAIFARPGFPLEENVKLIPMQPMPISASEIRARAKRGEDLSALVPLPVANYIARHRLYC